MYSVRIVKESPVIIQVVEGLETIVFGEFCYVPIGKMENYCNMLNSGSLTLKELEQ